MSIPESGYGIELLLLGPFEARLNGRPVSCRFYNKMRALLAYLAMERGKDHGREALASLFWPDAAPVTARGNLRRTLADLRRVLEKPAGKMLFATTKNTIRFNPNAYIDLIEFEDASQDLDSSIEGVIGLYRGEFMEGLSLPDCADFEEWLQLRRDSLHMRIIALLEKSASHCELSGNPDKALKFSMRHGELDPWDESVHIRIMRLYTLKGEQSSAYRQYLAYCQMMERELGLPPQEEVSMLAKRIRAGNLSLGIPHLSDTAISATERRQVTVLHCQLTETEDTEEEIVLLQEAQTHCIAILREYSGHVVQSHGGTLLVYFGYPEAQEHAARRAVEAALSLSHQSFPGMEIRAGIHSGYIVTSQDSSMPDIIGKTSGIAIQLSRLAGSGESVISSYTYRLVEGYFVCDNLDEILLYGTSRRMEAFRVLRASGARNRIEAIRQVAPLTGRSAEVGTLLGYWESAKRSKGRIVLASGEAGIGKTRLIRTIMEKVAQENITIRELRCFPESAYSPFHPLISMFESLYGFEAGDSAEIKFEKLSRQFEKLYPKADRNILRLLAQLLSIPVDEPISLPPQEIRENLTSAILDLLRHLASSHPVLYIIEDLHWIDPSTLELISRFAESEDKGLVLMVLTARPEFNPPWQEGKVEKMKIPPLSDKDVSALVKMIDEGIPEAKISQIVKRADGIPLYAEEMAKANCVKSIPPTLLDLFAVKLDKLGEAKLVAQLAATIGREFDIEMLRSISPSPSALDTHLNILQDTGLILKEPKCQFKHALIADAAYQSQTKSCRQEAHRKIAKALQLTAVTGKQPEILAQHLASGGETIPAIEKWIEAGKLASLQSANAEAVAHFRAGLELVDLVPVGDAQRNRLEFTLQTALGIVLQATQGYGSVEARRASERASALAGQVEDCPELFLVQWAQVMNTIASRGSIEALDRAQTLPALAQGDPVRMQAAHYALADASFWSGDFATTKAHTEMAIALYRPDHHPVLVEQFNEDLSVSCMAYLAWSSLFLGEPDEALRICKRMLDEARNLHHPHTLALALCFASVLHRWLEKPTETLDLSRKTIEVSLQHDFPVWLAAGKMTHGWAQVMLGREEAGYADLESGISGMRMAISGISVVFLSALIEAHVHLGMYDKALESIEEALADAERTGDGHFTAELHRLKGLCLLDAPMEAGKCFKTAIGISRRQGAKSLESKAEKSLALMGKVAVG